VKRLLTIFSVPVLALIVLSTVSAQSPRSDPRIGTWTLNVAKSKGNIRKSETRTYTQTGDSVTGHVEIVNSDGSTQVYAFTGKSDGKDYPYTGQTPGGAETFSTTRSGMNFVTQDKKDGKVLFTITTAFSADGKVMTRRTKGTDANGQPIDAVRVYDRQ